MQSFWLYLNNQKKITSLTTVEESVHEYILTEYENISTYTLTGLANTLYISPVIITTYLQKMGLPNFLALKEKIREDLKLLKLKNNYVSELYYDIKVLDDTQSSEIINKIKEKRSIYIFGTGVCMLPAQLLTRSLLTVNIYAIYISDPALITFLAQDTLIIVITNLGSTKLMKNIVAIAKARNYCLVALTNHNSYLHHHSNYTMTYRKTVEANSIPQEHQVKILLMITLLLRKIFTKEFEVAS